MATLTLIASLQNLQPKQQEDDLIVIETSPTPTPAQPIFVDIAGSVINPDVYELPPNSRMKTIIGYAGGFTSNADLVYIERHVNFAERLKDEEKIYIPSIHDTIMSEPVEDSPLVNLNSASLAELESLPGVGSVTAEKIVQNRPYKSINDLSERKIIGKATLQKLIDLITL